MFEIGLILFGAKRWVSGALKALLGNRYFWLATGLIVALWLAWRWHTATVAQAAQNATQAENARMSAQFERDKAQAVADEKRRAQSIIDANKEHYETQRTDLQNRAERLLADARTGAVRLRVPIKSCPVSGGDQRGTLADSGATATESRAELSEQSIQFFVGQAERADRQALQLNELIDLIDALRTGARP